MFVSLVESSRILTDAAMATKSSHYFIQTPWYVARGVEVKRLKVKVAVPYFLRVRFLCKCNFTLLDAFGSRFFALFLFFCLL